MRIPGPGYMKYAYGEWRGHQHSANNMRVYVTKSLKLKKKQFDQLFPSDFQR